MANVRFTSECLAFANVPCAHAFRGGLSQPLHDPRWKARVPRDAGAAWDFEDIRDYLRALLTSIRRACATSAGTLPGAVARGGGRNHDRGVRRMASCGVHVPGRPGLAVAGSVAGPGWGIVDARAPKSAWHALRQVWQPLQVILTDEGLNGLHAT
jgi:beta-mannosidase